MTVTVLEHEVVEVVETSEDPGQNAHIVLLPKHLKGKTTPQAYVMEARVMGAPVEALCGYKWVPKQDPEKLPVCPRCKEIFEYDPHGHGDRGDLPDA